MDISEKKNFMEMLKEFHNKDSINKGMDLTFIALIPKRKNMADFKDFSLISLLGYIYKLLGKKKNSLPIGIREVMVKT